MPDLADERAKTRSEDIKNWPNLAPSETRISAVKLSVEKKNLEKTTASRMNASAVVGDLT